MKVLVVTEYFPRRGDPVRGVWAHRQALATQEAGVEIQVLVLHRPVPPLSAIRRGDLNAALQELRQPRRAELDGLPVDYLHYLSPPRPWSYDTWGAWAAPWLARRLGQLHRAHAFDLIHAHYAVPAGDAVRRAAPELPLVVSVHGHDVFGVGAGGTRVRTVLQHARLVLANSAGTAERCRAAGASEVSVVHLGTDVPQDATPPPTEPLLVTVAHLAPRKRHEDVLLALARLLPRHPGLRYLIVGEGPARESLTRQVAELGLTRHVEFLGQLAPERARATAAEATLFVMPSVDEAFGVAYVEAMAAGVPAIGCRGEAGPEEIASSGGGMLLVEPRNPEMLAEVIDTQLSDPQAAAELRSAARRTVLEHYTWPACGRATLAGYQRALELDQAAQERR
jgi:glycosyltransferase involved in cell wall biosynthesis